MPKNDDLRHGSLDGKFSIDFHRLGAFATRLATTSIADHVNSFIDEYIGRLEAISSKDDVIALYRWFWERQDEVGLIARLINQELGLQGEEALQPDLPCLAIGGFKGVLILSANPGWRKDLNALEDAYCRASPSQYVELMLNFFMMHPIVVGQRIRWWNSALSWVRLLDDWRARFGVHSGERRWLRADTTQLVGGWELFPFHSSKDGLSGLMGQVEWLKRCARESLRAAIRVRPEVLFIASKSGWESVRRDLLPYDAWQDGAVGSSSFETVVSHRRQQNGTEIIAVARQIFAAPRNFTNEDLVNEINRLRRFR